MADALSCRLLATAALVDKNGITGLKLRERIAAELREAAQALPCTPRKLYIAPTVNNQAPPGTREGEMVVLETDRAGTPTIWCDPEIVDLVRALNENDIRTIASCSGHGKYQGWIALRDGRTLMVLPNIEALNVAHHALALSRPRPLDAKRLGEALANHGVIQRDALECPEDYDDYATVDRIHKIAAELSALEIAHG